tara:strand:+ start:451 stop:735 length:285 start_codon:yes stop_codon:yes gene_type:complete
MTFKHGRFNRHEVFEMKDTSLVLDIIGKVREVDSNNDNLINMLFGLFDGYWYYGVESALRYVNGVPASMIEDLSIVLKKVNAHIKANGPTYTLV